MAQQTHDGGTLPVPDHLDVANLKDDLDAGQRRACRARTERMAVLPQTDENGDATIYTVHSASGKTYTVDLEARDRCTCPDMIHNQPEGGCKHRRRVAIEIDETGLAAPGQPVDEDRRDAVLRRLENERTRLMDELETVCDLIDRVE
jgi:hypothetical protein